MMCVFEQNPALVSNDFIKDGLKMEPVSANFGSYVPYVTLNKMFNRIVLVVGHAWGIIYATNVSMKQYHCEEWGICRTGGMENFFHCSKCGMKNKLL
ncbi:hypothetical protein ACS0TY_023655 [Phlomoides rotata]